VKFFSNLHRSVFDPFFYREAIKFSWLRVVGFMFTLLLLASLVSGVFKTYYLVYSERSIAPIVNAMFDGMEIRDGELHTERQAPFELSGDLTAALLDRLTGVTAFGRMPENFAVVDNRNSFAGDDETVSAAKILLKKSSVLFKEMRIEVPYERFVGKNFEFTVSNVQRFLYRNTIAFAINFTILGFFFTLSTVLLSVFFLSLAAYLFSVDRTKKYGYFIRIACFSISPVMVGSALVAASGVSAEWAWYIFIVLSTMIMFRGMVHTSGNAPAAPDEKTGCE